MEDFFASPTAINPGERSALEISGGVLAGKDAMLDLLAQKPAGLRWRSLWPNVLDACVVTHNQLGDYVRELRGAGALEIPDWRSAAIKRPKDDYIIRLA